MDEAKRLMAVVEAQLEGKEWITGEYSIADIAIATWLRATGFYGVRDALNWDAHPNIAAYVERFEARPAVIKGLNTPARPT